MIFFQTKHWCQRCYRKIVLYSSLEAVTQFDALGPYKPLRLVKNEQTLAPSLALKHKMMTFKNNIISACRMSQHVLLELGLFMHALEKRGWGRMGWGGGSVFCWPKMTDVLCPPCSLLLSMRPAAEVTEVCQTSCGFPGSVRWCQHWGAARMPPGGRCWAACWHTPCTMTEARRVECSTSAVRRLWK